MITAKNYAAQAESWLRKASNLIYPYKNYELDNKYMVKYADLIKSAVHFAMPDNAIIFDDQLKGIRNECIRLPYPIMTIEYHCDKKGLPNKRLVLAVEIGRDSHKWFLDMVSKYNEINILDFCHDDKFICVFGFFEKDNKWDMIYFVSVIPSSWMLQTGQMEFIFQKGTYDTNGLYFHGYPFPALYGFYTYACDKLGKDRAINGGLHDIRNEVWALLEFIEALSCSNVTTEIIQNENKAVNQKRINKKKLPLYETRILTIETHKTVSASGITHADRRGPRQHLRRGHIRRLSDDRKIWVNSCVVGSIERGRIDKSYNVKHTANKCSIANA